MDHHGHVLRSIFQKPREIKEECQKDLQTGCVGDAAPRSPTIIHPNATKPHGSVPNVGVSDIFPPSVAWPDAAKDPTHSHHAVPGQIRHPGVDSVPNPDLGSDPDRDSAVSDHNRGEDDSQAQGDHPDHVGPVGHVIHLADVQEDTKFVQYPSTRLWRKMQKLKSSMLL